MEKLINTLNVVIARQAEATTSEMRIRGASNLDSMKVSFGPSWMQFADVRVVDNNPVYEMSAEQFAQYLAAKLAFARGK